MQWSRGNRHPSFCFYHPFSDLRNMTTSSAEETPWGSRYWRRPTPVVTRSVSKRRLRVSSQATNTTTISELGDDLLVEILIRSFPDPKSASRCKAVCKRWSSLISSPCFNRRFVSHHQKKKKNTKLILQNELLSMISSFLPPMPDRVEGETLHVFDTFKDLVLCGFWDADRHKRKHIRKYLICNPFTKKWIALPLPPMLCWLYPVPVARLVCEPQLSNNLDLGDDQAFVYSEYRFRVVCLRKKFNPDVSLKLDVFCSESGEWIHGAVALKGRIIRLEDVCSCNGELFWTYTIFHPVRIDNLVVVFNPFRLDKPPTFIDTSTTLLDPFSIPRITVSQDAVHLIPSNINGTALVSATLEPGAVIWRLNVQDDGEYSWKKQREVLVKKKNKCRCGWERKDLVEPLLHPYNPEIVFLKCFGCGSNLYSLDLSRGEEGEVKLLGKVEVVDRSRFLDIHRKVFELRFSCWPTPIPTYKELPEHIPWM